MGDKHSNMPPQSENGFPFKQITLLGMDIFSNQRQPENAPYPIAVTLSGMAILDKLQPANALLHIILVPSLTE